MKSLNELQEDLTGNKEVDFDLIYNEMCSQVYEEQDFFKQMELCKFLKKNCETYSLKSSIYLQKINQLEKEFFTYIEKKVNLKNSKKQWDNMIYYLNIAFDYFDINNKVIIFDNFEDYFIYSTLNIKGEKYNFTSGINGWLYYKRAFAYKNLKIYDKAIDDLQSCIKCSPMSFMPFELLANCYLDLKDCDNLKKCLEDSYKIIKTFEDLGCYYFYYAQYFYLCKNFQMVKACAFYGLKFNLSLNMKNKIVGLINEILADKFVVTDAFNMLPEELLLKKNIPTWFSKDIMISYLVLYKACVRNVVDNKNLKNSVRKKLYQFKLNAYAQQIEINETTNENMYLFENLGFCCKLSKNWQVIYINENKNLKDGTLMQCINNDDSISFVVDVNSQKYSLEYLYNMNIETLKNSGFTFIKQKDIFTINKNTIKSLIVKSKSNKKVLMNFLMLDNNILLILSTNMQNDDSSDKLLLNIIKTIQIYKPIKIKVY